MYHLYGRKPFLDYFDNLKRQNNDEDFLFAKYRELDSRHSDDTQAKSWFRDQVLHPYETQHTLKEVVDEFIADGVELITTSINAFKPYSSLEELYAMEKNMYKIGEQFLTKRKYYPGFFYVIGRKKE